MQNLPKRFKLNTIINRKIKDKDNMQISEVNKVTDQFVEDIARLLPQLTKSAVPDKETIAEIVASPNTILIAADLNGIVVGILTLVIYRIPSSLRARIEDVVVDESSRGKGIGPAMITYAIDIAAQKKVVGVDLTSRPTRKTANQLYKKLGFEQYETNVYRINLK